MSEIIIQRFPNSVCGLCSETFAEDGEIYFVDCGAGAALMHPRCAVEALESLYDQHSAQVDAAIEDGDDPQDIEAMRADLVSLRDMITSVSLTVNRVNEEEAAYGKLQDMVERREQIPQAEANRPLITTAKLLLPPFDWKESNTVPGAVVAKRALGNYALYPPASWPPGSTDDRRHTHARLVFLPNRKGEQMVEVVEPGFQALRELAYTLDWERMMHFLGDHLAIDMQKWPKDEDDEQADHGGEG